MRVPSDDLFLLIKAMNSNEKRYFKLYSNRKKNSYIKLFNAIDRQEKSDEKRIRERMRMKENDFNQVKTILYRKVLKSLIGYNSKTASTEMQLMQFFIEVEILYNKKLYKQCKKKLKTAKSLALRHEKYYAHIKIIQWERKLIRIGYAAEKAKEEIDLLHEEEGGALKKLQNIHDYIGLSDKVGLNWIQDGDTRSSLKIQGLKNIMNNPLFKDENNALSADSKTAYHYVHAVSASEYGDFGKSYHHFKKITELLESNPENFTEASANYLSSLSNLMLASFQLKKYDECFSVIKKMRTVHEKITNKSLKEYFRSYIFEKTYSIELAIYIETGEFEKGLFIARDIEKWLVECSRKKLHNYEVITMAFNIASLFFIVNKHDKAQKWLNEILNNSADIKKDIYCLAKILYLISCFETAKISLMEYALKSTYRYLLKKNRVYKFETVILKFIRQSSFSPDDPKKLMVFYKELHSEFIEISKDAEERRVFEYFDFISWVESKTENRSLEEIIKEKEKSLNE